MFKQVTKQPGKVEFIALCAMLTSTVALTIDSMLPALPNIGHDLNVANAVDTQLVVSILFAGFAIGQLLMGPLSDNIGRKKAIYLGIFIFLIGCVLSIISESFEMMLVGRFLQGIGVAGPRIVSIAMIRDLFEGRGMAQIMSFVMAVFIIAPALAPALGQGILYLASWRWIFLSLALVGIICFFWLALRQPETLKPEKRLPFSAHQIWIGIRETCTNRIAIGYTVSSGIVFGGFVSYLATAQQIFHEAYGLGDQFPLFFGILALAIGLASAVNGKLVLKYGMRRLLYMALLAKIILCFLFLPYVYVKSGIPELVTFMTWGCLVFFCTGILFGNFSALALEPMGHIAGVASSTFGALSTIVAVVLGYFIGIAFNGTILPMIAGFAILALLGYFLVSWTEKSLWK